jgi:hypothetical protein
MLIYKNMASGKHFIFLNDIGNDEGLFVTPPMGDDKVIIHSLKYEIFHDDPIELDENDGSIDELLSSQQIERFIVFKEKDRRRTINNVIKWAIATKVVDIESIRKEIGEEFATLIKLIREDAKGLTVDDLE